MALFGVAFLVAGAPLAAMEQSCRLGDRPGTINPELPPEVAVWSADAVRQAAEASACQELPLASAKTLVVLRGGFHFDGSLDDLLTHIGAISKRAHLRYWSVTDKEWRELIADAHAVRLSTHEEPREDFMADELRAGGDLFYVQRDNRSSHSVIYKMQVRVVGVGDVIVETENVTAVRYFFIPLFPAATLHSEVRLHRRLNNVWEVLQIDWVGPAANAFSRGHEASYVNRAIAMFRYIAGIPSDLMPPAAP